MRKIRNYSVGILGGVLTGCACSGSIRIGDYVFERSAYEYLEQVAKENKHDLCKDELIKFAGEFDEHSDKVITEREAREGVEALASSTLVQ
jgi:hypothetical protein